MMAIRLRMRGRIDLFIGVCSLNQLGLRLIRGSRWYVEHLDYKKFEQLLGQDGLESGHQPWNKTNTVHKHWAWSLDSFVNRLCNGLHGARHL